MTDAERYEALQDKWERRLSDIQERREVFLYVTHDEYPELREMEELRASLEPPEVAARRMLTESLRSGEIGNYLATPIVVDDDEGRRATSLPMTLAVIGAGARDWTDRDLIYKKLDHLLVKRGAFILIEGTAGGADRICGSWARGRKSAGVEHEPMPAEWQVHAEGWCPGDWCAARDHCATAGFRRNQAMVDRALELADEQFAIVFKDNFGRGPSGGTEDLVRRVGAAGFHGVKVSHDRKAQALTACE